MAALGTRTFQRLTRHTLAHKASPGYVRTTKYLPRRTLSTQADNQQLQIQMDSTTGVATLTMNKKPANILDGPFMKSIITVMQDMARDKCRGVIIASGIPRLYSAGLDIDVLLDPEHQKLEEFWRTLQDFWLTLYSSKLPTVAAINGHAPAAGCKIALACDTRVMVRGKYTIGLNESKLGIKLPPWLGENLINTIGQLEAEKALKLGKLFTCEEALAVNLVDELCEEAELMDRANHHMAQWLSVPEPAFGLTKTQTRVGAIERMLAGREQDVRTMVGHISSKYTQDNITNYISKLKKKPKS